MVARDARKGQPRALPELMVVDLGDRRSEPLLQLRGSVPTGPAETPGAHCGIEPTGDQPAGFDV